MAASTTATKTIQLNLGSSASFSEITCIQANGQNATNAGVDQHTLSGAVSGGGGTDTLSVGPLTTTAVNEYVVAYAYTENGTTGAIAAGTGFTLRASSTSVTTTGIEDGAQASIGAITGKWSPTNSTNYVVGMMTIKP
jgi:hypothetical protein